MGTGYTKLIYITSFLCNRSQLKGQKRFSFCVVIKWHSSDLLLLSRKTVFNFCGFSQVPRLENPQKLNFSWLYRSIKHHALRIIHLGCVFLDMDSPTVQNEGNLEVLKREYEGFLRVIFPFENPSRSFKRSCVKLKGFLKRRNPHNKRLKNPWVFSEIFKGNGKGFWREILPLTNT